MTDHAEAIYRLILAYAKGEISERPFEAQIEKADDYTLRMTIRHLAYYLHGYVSGVRGRVTEPVKPE